MQTRKDFLDSLDQKINELQAEVEKRFYYLESEDLHFKNFPEQWNIIEVFAHLNLANEHYLKELRSAFDKSPDGGKESFKIGWMGRQMVKSMEPREGKTPFKMKTFKKTDPLLLQSKGHKLVDHVVFQDFMDHLKQFKEIITEARNKDLRKIKITSLISLLKLRVGDALAFIIAHMERHLLQATRLHPKHRQ